MSTIIGCATGTDTTTAPPITAERETVQSLTTQLYAVGALANVYLSFLAAYRAGRNAFASYPLYMWGECLGALRLHDCCKRTDAVYMNVS